MTCKRNSDNKYGFVSLILRHLHLLFKQWMLPEKTEKKEGIKLDFHNIGNMKNSKSKLQGGMQLFPAAWKELYASANRENNPEICGKNIGAELSGLGYEKRRCLAGNGPCCDYAVGPEPRWRHT